MSNVVKNIGGLQVTLPSDREIAMTRVFAAPRSLVWDCHTKPELVQRWMGVIPGWSWAVCEIDLRVGGKYRYVWRNTDGGEMGMGGEYRELSAPARLVAAEKFDEPWYAGDAIETTELVEKGGKTTLTIVVRYDSKEVRDSVLKSPMAEGMSAGYDNLDKVLASTLNQKAS